MFTSNYHRLISSAGRSKRVRGLTLVELMIALAIGLVLILVVAAVYVSSRQTYRSGEGISRLQESARFAFTFMSRDIRQAGFFGCVGGAATVNNVLNNATNPAFDFQRAINGFDAAIGGSAWTPDLPTGLTGTVTPVSGSDVFIVRGLSGVARAVIDHPVDATSGIPGGAPIEVGSNSGFAAGDIVLATDCVGATVFQLSGVSTSGARDLLSHAAGGGSPGNTTSNLGREFGDGDVMRVASNLYFVGTNPAGRPALYRRELSSGSASEELVEGVENLQVLYGVDTDGDRSADTYLRADEVATANQWERVVSLRLEMLVQSPDDNLATEPMSYVIGGVTTPYVSADRRLRQVYSSIVTLRNRVD